MDLARLLAVPMYRAFDIDAEGRVLAGSDESGSVQLTEIQPNGDMVTLTALPGARWGRYLAGPGERAIIVVHDEGGNERYQLSLLKLPRDGAPATFGDLEPIVRDPRFIHSLADVRPGAICYLTNRRNGVDFDPVIRDLATGAEQTVYVGSWLIHEAVLSPDGRWLAVNVALPTVAHSTQLLLVDLTARGTAHHRGQPVRGSGPEQPAALAAGQRRAGVQLQYRAGVHRAGPLRPGDRRADLAGHRRWCRPAGLAVTGRFQDFRRAQRRWRVAGQCARR